MLGNNFRLLIRPLGPCHRTRAFWTAVNPYTHKLLRHEALKTANSRRYKSTAVGDVESGHIEAGKNEGIFFIDSGYSGGSLPSGNAG